MNIYHAWRALKVGVSDIAFGEGVAKYLDHLRAGIDRKRAFGVNSLVQNVYFALYRDFPDPQRRQGAERFQ